MINWINWIEALACEMINFFHCPQSIYKDFVHNFNHSWDHDWAGIFLKTSWYRITLRWVFGIGNWYQIMLIFSLFCAFLLPHRIILWLSREEVKNLHKKTFFGMKFHNSRIINLFTQNFFEKGLNFNICTKRIYK